MKNLNFSKLLLNWHSLNARPHPWKTTKDPYYIWLSEIILQQTRVEAGTPYYLVFVKTFPTIQDLAKASLDEVYALWKGLGYYSRARNLHHTAKEIVNSYAGTFPSDYESILSLKGIGPYTAAAISSFAFDLPYPVMDGNVKRILARYYGYQKDVLSTTAKKELTKLLVELFDPKVPAAFNQAIMDFGATVCKPKGPDCQKCPFTKACFAYKNKQTQTLPVRISKILRKDRFFHYFVFRSKSHVLLRQRRDKDIWQHLYDFPLIETDKNEALTITSQRSYIQQIIGRPAKRSDIISKGPKSQILSHQRIIARFYTLEFDKLDGLIKDGEYHLVELNNYSSFAVPKIIDWYLRDNSISLFG